MKFQQLGFQLISDQLVAGGRATKLIVSHSSLWVLSLTYFNFQRTCVSHLLMRCILDSSNTLSASLINFNTLLYCFLRIAYWLQIYPSLFYSLLLRPSIFILLFSLKFFISKSIASSRLAIIFFSNSSTLLIRLLVWYLFVISSNSDQLIDYKCSDGNNVNESSRHNEISRISFKHLRGCSEVRKSFSHKMLDIDFMQCLFILFFQIMKFLLILYWLKKSIFCNSK